MFCTIGVVIVALILGQVAAGLVDPGVLHENAITGVSAASQRIMSGWEAYPGQFPFVAQIRFYASTSQFRNCGGSIIHNNWVISSAFCATIVNRTHARVSAGVTNLSTTPAYVSETSEWWIHPLFNVASPSSVQPYDILVLKLQRSLVYSALVQPIRIEPSAEAFRDYTNELLFTMGWGRVAQSNVNPNVLNWVYLRGITIQECRSFYPSSVITENHICAAGFHFDSQSTCTNDDGGPMTRLDQSGEPVLVGIIGFWHGTPCGNGRPSGFNRVSPFHSWITDITGIDFDEANGSPTTETPELSTTEVTRPTTETPVLSTTDTDGPPITEVTRPTTETPEFSTTDTDGPPITEVTRPPTTDTLEISTTEVTRPPSTETVEPPTTEVGIWPPGTEATDPPTTDATESPVTEATESPITEVPKPDSEESDEDQDDSDSSESEEDPEISQLLNKLVVKVKVKVKVNNMIKKNVTITN